MNRRQFLSSTVVVLAAGAAVPQIVFAGPHWETQLRQSDLRELWQYRIEYDAWVGLWSIAWHRDATRVVQFEYARMFTRELDISSPVERERMLSFARKDALYCVQREFTKRRRIRGNLVPLQVPRGYKAPAFVALSG